MRITRVRIVVLTVVVALAASACSQDPTESSEYMALQAELEDRTNELSAARDELTTERSQLEDVRSELDATSATLEESTAKTAELEQRLSEAETSIAGLEESLAESETRADDAVAKLAELEDVPWPDSVKALFIEGCAVDERGRPNPEAEPVCGCMVDGLEREISLVDFLLLSILAIDPTVQVDPETGLPTDMDPDVVDAFLDVAFRCALSA